MIADKLYLISSIDLIEEKQPSLTGILFNNTIITWNFVETIE